MVKTFLITLLAAFSLSSLAAFSLSSPVLADQNLRTQAIETVLHINDNCSAVNLDNHHLLTAAHCVKGTSEGKMTIDDTKGLQMSVQTVYYFDVSKIDVDKDLALLTLRSDSFKAPVARVAKSLVVQEGDEVFTVGFPAIVGRTVTQGLFNGISAVKYPMKVSFRLRASPAIFGGNSGGGLFQHDGDGGYELIGITNATFQSVTHLAIYTTLDDIKEFLGKDG